MSVNTINPSEVHQLTLSGRSPVIIDVRTPAEIFRHACRWAPG